MTPLSVSLRPARSTDAPAAWRVRTRAIAALEPLHYTREELALWAAVPQPAELAGLLEKTAGWAAEVEGQLVGWGFLSPAGDEVAALFVDPAWQRRGIARRLLAALEQSARDLGAHRLEVNSSLDAAACYERAGFQRLRTAVHRHPQGFDLPCVLLEKFILGPVATRCDS